VAPRRRLRLAGVARFPLARPLAADAVGVVGVERSCCRRGSPRRCARGSPDGARRRACARGPRRSRERSRRSSRRFRKMPRFLEPLRPQELALLLARRAKRPHEAAQHPLDHRAKETMLSGKADGPDSQQLLEVLLHQTVEGGLLGPSRLVDPTADLHTSRPAGRRASGENGRGCCPSRPAPGGRKAVSNPSGSERVRRPARD
jgi:hypothetical protein